MGTRVRLVQNTCPNALGPCCRDARNVWLSLRARGRNWDKIHDSRIQTNHPGEAQREGSRTCPLLPGSILVYTGIGITALLRCWGSSSSTPSPGTNRNFSRSHLATGSTGLGGGRDLGIFSTADLGRKSGCILMKTQVPFDLTEESCSPFLSVGHQGLAE